MKAIGYTARGSASAGTSAIEFDAVDPRPLPHDLLIEVRGVSVNPVDVKVRANREPEGGDPRILGFDGSGVVREVGADVRRFKPGDHVFWAGDIGRAGSNAALQVVDERIVGPKPASLDFADAAAIPLTSITAWELLFESLGVVEGGGSDGVLLVIGGAGGVGSILIQLAKKLTALTVVATASRPESSAWVETMGADHVVDHRQPLPDELGSLGLAPTHVASLTATDQHFDSIVEVIRPRGRIAIIDDPAGLDISAIKTKSLSFSWEFMFTRPMFGTDDMDAQHELLTRVSTLIDDGILASTVNRRFGPLTATNLRAALELQETGSAIGKSVLEGCL